MIIFNDMIRLNFYRTIGSLKWKQGKDLQEHYGYNIWPLLSVPFRFQLCSEHDIIICRKKNKDRKSGWLSGTNYYC